MVLDLEAEVGPVSPDPNLDVVFFCESLRRLLMGQVRQVQKNGFEVSLELALLRKQEQEKQEQIDAENKAKEAQKEQKPLAQEVVVTEDDGCEGGACKI